MTIHILSDRRLQLSPLAAAPAKRVRSILRLYRGVDPARAEAVSVRALEIGALTCKSIASILAHKRDKTASNDVAQKTLFEHVNLRGPGYYH